LTNDSIPDIVHIGREAKRAVSAAVVACEKKMFSMADVIGLVWNGIFESMISQTKFYKKIINNM